jgi:hypothetical protein
MTTTRHFVNIQLLLVLDFWRLLTAVLGTQESKKQAVNGVPQNDSVFYAQFMHAHNRQ